MTIDNVKQTAVNGAIKDNVHKPIVASLDELDNAIAALGDELVDKSKLIDELYVEAENDRMIIEDLTRQLGQWKRIGRMIEEAEELRRDEYHRPAHDLHMKVIKAVGKLHV